MIEAFFKFFGVKKASSSKEGFSAFSVPDFENKISAKDFDDSVLFANLDCPSEHSLVDKMPKVFNQGERQTCTAQALATMLGYFYQKSFSSQFLYWAAMRQDGSAKILKDFYLAKDKKSIAAFKDFLKAKPHLKSQNIEEQGNAFVDFLSGTSLESLKEVIENFGVCEYNFMPYSWAENSKNTALIDESLLEEFMQNALLNAQNFKTKLKFLSANSIDEYRNRLSGSDSFEPMPVAFSAYLFDNEEDGSGWFSMPKEGQVAIGAHTILAVGYKDSPLVAGGGYLIVRNSWGSSWAWNYKNSGYARIPYAYISNYTYPNALSIISDKKEKIALAQSLKNVDTFSRYIKIAERDMRNRNGKFNIAKGDKIIVDKQSGLADLDSLANRNAFKENGYSWED